MNLFDKVCTVVAIPMGLLFMGLGILGLIEWNQLVQLKARGPILILPVLFGWGMSITLIRFWLHSNGEKREAEDNDPLSSPFASDPRYRQFLHEHPEFLHAPRALRHHGFSTWLTRRTAQVGGV